MSTKGTGTKYYGGNNVVGGLILDTSILDRITADMKPKAARIIEMHGTNMAGVAAQNAPVDTSALRNSLLENSGMVGELTYAIQDGVEYGIFQELGTSRMAAQPFVIPAIESNADRFINAFKELFR